MTSSWHRRTALQSIGALLGGSLAGCLFARLPSQPQTETPGSREERPLANCPSYTQSYPDGWSTFGYDAANTGANLDALGPKDGVTVRWRFETGGPVQAPPSVADGTVYAASRDHNVYALAASDGTEQWRFETGLREKTEDTHRSQGPMRSAPTVVGDTVYVGGGNYELHVENGALSRVGNHAYVYALSAADGSERWRYQPQGVVESTPMVVDGTVYFGCESGFVYAVDATDGTERWRFRVDEPASQGVSATPAVHNCTVYVGSWGGTLYALDARDGAVEWRFEADEAVSASSAVSDGAVYVGVNGGGPVYALSTTDGSVEWKYPTGGSVVASSPAIADGVVYVGNYSSSFTLTAIDAETGESVWKARSGYIWTSPAVVDGMVYAADLQFDNLYGFDVDDGTKRWSFKANDLIRSSPAVADGTVYFGSDDGNVYALVEG